MFWFWFFCGPALALAFLSLRGERKRAAYVADKLADTGGWTPPATVIVPVKGPEEKLRENLAALASQDYPDYELIVAARQASDIPAGVLPSGVKVVLSHAPEEEETSEKVQNLLAAVKAARKTSDLLAFADADGRVRAGWLRALAAPLAEPGVGAATGYRWYTPEPPDFWSLVRSVWNAATAGILGPGSNPFAWGGAMSLRKEAFFELGMPERWKRAISDDYTLAGAVRGAGLRIAFAPGAMVSSSDRIGARPFLVWAARQMKITRACRPGLWWQALVAPVFYCGAMAASIYASIQGNRGAEWVLVAMLGPMMLKGLNRATIAKSELPEKKAWFDRHAWVHAWWTPLMPWVWLLVLLLSARGDTIEWRGRRYTLSTGRSGRARL